VIQTVRNAGPNLYSFRTCVSILGTDPFLTPFDPFLTPFPVEISFNSGCNCINHSICRSPKLAQIVITYEKQFGRRIVHWAVWRLDTDRSHSPWYPSQHQQYEFVDMADAPGTRWWNPTTWVWGAIQSFETCAICTDNGKNWTIGCVSWGHDVGGIGASSSWGAGKRKLPVPPSTDFLSLFPYKSTSP
jgi:hypothetical protein